MLKFTDCLLVAKTKFTSDKTGKTYYKARFLLEEELVDFEISPQQFGELSTGICYDAEFQVKSMFGRITFVLGSCFYAESTD